VPQFFSAKRDRRYYKNLLVFAGSVILVVSIGLYFGLPTAMRRLTSDL
jgi:hypothetical protein